MSLLLELFTEFALLSFVAFGGATALLPELYRVVVEQQHWMDATTFAHMYAIAQAAPGPNVLVVTLIGWQVAGLGVSGYYLASTLDFLGLQYISASLERAILYLNPTLVLLLSALFLGRRILRLQWVATGLAYLGVMVVFWHDWDLAHLMSSHDHGLPGPQAIALGSTLVLASALAYAVYLMGSSEVVHRIGSLRLVSYASCLACVLCMLQWAVLHVATAGQVGGVMHLPWQAYGLSAINAVACTVLPIGLVMKGVQLLGAPLASQVGMVGPLSTILMAAWWLQEPLTWRLAVGTACILGGIVLLTRSPAGR